jgi:hypothetical protein
MLHGWVKFRRLFTQSRLRSGRWHSRGCAEGPVRRQVEPRSIAGSFRLQRERITLRLVCRARPILDRVRSDQETARASGSSTFSAVRGFLDTFTQPPPFPSRLYVAAIRCRVMMRLLARAAASLAQISQAVATQDVTVDLRPALEQIVEQRGAQRCIAGPIRTALAAGCR